jgi:hypothetical protein
LLFGHYQCSVTFSVADLLFGEIAAGMFMSPVVFPSSML